MESAYDTDYWHGYADTHYPCIRGRIRVPPNLQSLTAPNKQQWPTTDTSPGVCSLGLQVLPNLSRRGYLQMRSVANKQASEQSASQTTIPTYDYRRRPSRSISWRYRSLSLPLR